MGLELGLFCSAGGAETGGRMNRLLMTAFVTTTAGAFAACTTATTNPPDPTGGIGSGAAGGATSDGGSGVGGAGGSTGVGGDDGDPCMDASEYDDRFQIEITGFCVVAKYTAPFVLGFDDNFKELRPTWGRHGGPMILEQSASPLDSITITRFAVPSGITGELTVDATIGPIDLEIDEDPLFMNATAVDLPFDNWTLVGWSEFGSSAGEAIMLDGDAVAARFDVFGLFSGVGVRVGDDKRLLTASLGELHKTVEIGNEVPVAGLYAAEFCEGASLCSLPNDEVHQQGDANGPVAIDDDGNVFAMFPNLTDGNQTLRGFAADGVAPGGGVSEGTELYTIDDSGLSLAARAPDETGPGHVFFQAYDFTDGYGDVTVQRYSVSGDTLSAEGTQSTAFEQVMDTAVEFGMMTDDAGRLWMGTPTEAGETIFFVLDQKRLPTLGG